MDQTKITRSGLNIIRGRVGSYFCAVQGERSAVDRVSMSDLSLKECALLPRPYGLDPEIRASGVAALGNSTTIPCARRLAPTKFKMANFRTQRDRG